MTTARRLTSRQKLISTSITLLVLTLTALHTDIATAQVQALPAPPTQAELRLPDAPGFSSSSLSGDNGNDTPGDDAAPAAGDVRNASGVNQWHWYATRHDIIVQPGEAVPVLTVHNKVVLGLEQSFTLFSVIGWTTSAGYSQIFNDAPNFGTDSGAFGMRLGATALRNISQNVLGNSVFAPVFHEDPRYYRLGKGHNFAKRTVYAATRALITRSDSGSERPNYALLSGNLAGAALTNLYYPRMNQGVEQTAKTFGTSVGGSAIGFFVTEFLDDALDAVHLQRFE